MLRFLLAAAIAMGGGVAAATPVGADPEPPPPGPPALPIPDVTNYMPVNPADYTVNAGKWYAFAGLPGVVCVLDTLSGDYGCSGPLPGAPNGVNLVSGRPVGPPEFATADPAIYASAGDVRPLPPGTRLAYRQVFCGVDQAGVVACLNSREQVGFVVGPNGTYIGSNAPAPAAPDAPVP